MQSQQPKRSAAPRMSPLLIEMWWQLEKWLELRWELEKYNTAVSTLDSVKCFTAFCPIAALVKHISQGLHIWHVQAEGLLGLLGILAGGGLFKLFFSFECMAERLNQAQTPKDYLLCCFHMLQLDPLWMKFIWNVLHVCECPISRCIHADTMANMKGFTCGGIQWKEFRRLEANAASVWCSPLFG